MLNALVVGKLLCKQSPFHLGNLSVGEDWVFCLHESHAHILL